MEHRPTPRILVKCWVKTARGRQSLPLSIRPVCRSRCVPSLAVPDLGSRMDADQLLDYAAPRLLMHRILQVRPEFPFDDGNLAAVLQICSRLDGIPGMSRLY